MKRSFLTLNSVEGQIFATLAVTFLILFGGMMLSQIMSHRDAVDWAKSEYAFKKISLKLPLIDTINSADLDNYTVRGSTCHDGFTVTDTPYAAHSNSVITSEIRALMAQRLLRPESEIAVTRTKFSRSDFAYSKCDEGEFDFPLDGVVISVRLESGAWLNSDFHAEKFRIAGRTFNEISRIGFLFVIVSAAAFFFIRRLTRPLSILTRAASRFGSDLEVEELEEHGPADVKNAIRSFNVMQREVKDEMTRRSHMLAAVGHDIKTPLTALRVKTELIRDPDVKGDIIRSVNKMERITSSALDYVRGESRSEEKQNVDLRALIESECSEFEELGEQVEFSGEQELHYRCRPIALARAVRNLIENAVKYGSATNVEITKSDAFIEIRIIDKGPGLPEEQFEYAFDPFKRFSDARESDQGGFGLGLPIAKAIVQGHDGSLQLKPNTPSGLCAIIQLPLSD